MVEDLLEMGRMPAPVTQPVHPTQFPCNEVGKPRQAWPTFVSFEEVAAFRMHDGTPGPGMVYDCTAREWQEPTALERELAMGFMEDATAHPEEHDEMQHERGHPVEKRWVYPWEEEDEVPVQYAEQLEIRLPGEREEAVVDKKREDFGWLEEAIEWQRSRESYGRKFGSWEFALMATTKEGNDTVGSRAKKRRRGMQRRQG
ncbi:unnamed protein product [Closterium sp. Naga37s-1]|nr:unnamed protein product [Closterium sp. Naga37s-1]